MWEKNYMFISVGKPASKINLFLEWPIKHKRMKKWYNVKQNSKVFSATPFLNLPLPFQIKWTYLPVSSIFTTPIHISHPVHEPYPSLYSSIFSTPSISSISSISSTPIHNTHSQLHSYHSKQRESKHALKKTLHWLKSSTLP